MAENKYIRNGTFVSGNLSIPVHEIRSVEVTWVKNSGKMFLALLVVGFITYAVLQDAKSTDDAKIGWLIISGIFGLIYYFGAAQLQIVTNMRQFDSRGGIVAAYSKQSAIQSAQRQRVRS